MYVHVCVYVAHGTATESQQRTRGGSQNGTSSPCEGQLIVLYSFVEEHVDDTSSSLLC